MNGFVTFKVDPPPLSLASGGDAGLILSCLATLPVRTRAILLLHRFDRLNCTEIGERLGLPEAIVAADLAAALEALLG